MSCGLEHNTGPSNYMEWHEWAEEMSKTHGQRRCPVTGLYDHWFPLTQKGDNE